MCLVRLVNGFGWVRILMLFFVRVDVGCWEGHVVYVVRCLYEHFLCYLNIPLGDPCLCMFVEQDNHPHAYSRRDSIKSILH